MEGLFDCREAGLAARAGVRRKNGSVALILAETGARLSGAPNFALDRQVGCFLQPQNIDQLRTGAA